MEECMTVVLMPCAGDGAAGHEHAAAGGLALRGGAGAAVGVLASARPRLRLLASGQRQPRAARVGTHGILHVLYTCDGMLALVVRGRVLL